MSRAAYPVRWAVQDAQRHHSNLTVFNAVVSVLEGGNVYGENKARDRIIAICKKEMQRQLKLMDKAVIKAAGLPK